MIRAAIELVLTVEGHPDEISPAKLIPIALSYGYSIEAEQMKGIESNSADKVRLTFTATSASSNPVKALDDAIDLIFQSQDTMNRKELIEWGREHGQQELQA